ncbi:MAG TPA: ABC transporter permease [Candidatus Dormibacteraeota bacterium]|nr:ABC transporter permease [Candidatus Dormibacteraeota bacterium]
MTFYVVRRILQSVVVVLVVVVVVFALTRFLPGGPARAIMGPRATKIQVQNFEKTYGLDQPIPVQFVDYLAGLGRADLGSSYKRNQTVTKLIGEYLPVTLVLMGISTALAVVIAIPIGMLQAWRRNTAVDHGFTGILFVFYSMPVFWLGLILITVFSSNLGWLPSGGPQGGLRTYGSQLSTLILPVTTLALVTIALFSRYLRSAMIESLVQDYVRTARAKGASMRRVMFRHVLPNSLLSAITLLGLSIPYIFSGALIVEELFNYPGMGLLFWNAAESRDYPVVIGVALIVALATVVGNLLADLAYAIADPRIRYIGR